MGDPIPFASEANVSIDCESQEDVYLATSVVFDSGFETFHVSENSDLIRCPQ